MLQQVGKRGSKIYAINRKLTIFAFFLVRIIPIPIYWYAAGWNWFYNGYENCDLPIKLCITISGIALDFLNISWFGKLAKGIKSAEKKTKSGFERSEDPTESGIFSLKKMKLFLNHT